MAGHLLQVQRDPVETDKIVFANHETLNQSLCNLSSTVWYLRQLSLNIVELFFEVRLKKILGGTGHDMHIGAGYPGQDTCNCF